MNKVFIRRKLNLNNISKCIIVALIPLILAGFYKNGIKLCIHNLVSALEMFKPLLFSLLGFIIGSLVNIIYDKRKDKNQTIKEMITSSFHPLYGLLIASVISINTNILVFTILTFIILFASKYFNESKINVIALTGLIITLIMQLFNDFSFLNIYEKQNSLNLNILDYFIGRGVGGINTSHLLLLLVSLIILTTKDFYKKDIPLYSSLTFLGFMIIYGILKEDINLIFSSILSNEILFSFIFIATDPLSSSYTNKGMIIYSLIIGIITFGIYLVYPEISSLVGILIASLIHKPIDKMTQKLTKS